MNQFPRIIRTKLTNANAARTAGCNHHHRTLASKSDSGGKCRMGAAIVPPIKKCCGSICKNRHEDGAITTESKHHSGMRRFSTTFTLRADHDGVHKKDFGSCTIDQQSSIVNECAVENDNVSKEGDEAIVAEVQEANKR